VAGSGAIALALAVAASLAIAAPSSPAPPAAAPLPELQLPVRAAFYESRYPIAWPRTAHERPARGRYGMSLAIVREQIAAMAYGGIGGAIAPWDGIGTLSARRVPLLLRAASGTPFRWALRVTGTRFKSRRAATGAITAVAHRYGARAAYLRLGGRPVVFVADAGASCAHTARWVAANRPWVYLMLPAFPGNLSCRAQPDGWYSNDSRLPEQGVPPFSFTISPGRFPAASKRPVLARDLDRFGANVRAMVASGARFQLIDSFNRWAGGSAVENSGSWRTASGFGAFLDVLHENGGAAPPPPPSAPTATGAAIPTVPAHGSPPPPPPPPSTTAPVTPPPPPPPVTTAPTPPPPPPPTTTVPLPPPPPSAGDPVIAAVGDIACDPANVEFNGGQGTSNSCAQQATANLLGPLWTQGNLAAILTLGDTQYEVNTYPAFLQSFDKSWGKYKEIIHPAVGNHEYLTPGAAGYYQYFGAAAGNPHQGFYSFDAGAWHLIALNSNCGDAGGCSPGSPQGKWLVADLASHKSQCVLAYWHIPLFSSGGRTAPNSRTFWDVLYAAGADVILTSHDHLYERFAPQTPAGAPDPVKGIRTWVVGTGGNNHTSFVDPIFPNSEVRDDNTFGILQMTLHPQGYDWRFLPVAGKSFTDAGSGTCH
jgi:hypothetical protein